MAQHAKYSMSKLPRLLACPGSHAMCEGVPDKTSSYADEGTLLHSYIADILLERMLLQQVPAEHRGTIEECYDYVQMIAGTLDMPVEYIEQHFTLLPKCAGTADVVLLGRCGNLHVIDWKFGRGEAVFAEHNEQLMGYAAAFLTSNVRWQSVQTVTIHVFQPRINNNSSWCVFPIDLQSWVEGSLKPTLDGIESGRPMPRVFGDKQCRFCRGKMRCPEYIQYVEDKAVEIFEAYADKLTDESRLVALYKTFKSLEIAMDAIRDHLMAQALAGNTPAGLKLVAGKSSRAWKNEELAAQWLMENGFDEIYTEPKFMSVAQIEKLSSKLKKDSAFLELYDKNEGNPALVSEDDKREALGMRATEVFSNFVEK